MGSFETPILGTPRPPMPPPTRPPTPSSVMSRDDHRGATPRQNCPRNSRPTPTEHLGPPRVCCSDSRGTQRRSRTINGARCGSATERGRIPVQRVGQVRRNLLTVVPHRPGSGQPVANTSPSEPGPRRDVASGPASRPCGTTVLYAVRPTKRRHPAATAVTDLHVAHGGDVTLRGESSEGRVLPWRLSLDPVSYTHLTLPTSDLV